MIISLCMHKWKQVAITRINNIHSRKLRSQIIVSTNYPIKLIPIIWLFTDNNQKIIASYKKKKISLKQINDKESRSPCSMSMCQLEVAGVVSEILNRASPSMEIPGNAKLLSTILLPASMSSTLPWSALASSGTRLSNRMSRSASKDGNPAAAESSGDGQDRRRNEKIEME